jgi:hypothetical protein
MQDNQRLFVKAAPWMCGGVNPRDVKGPSTFIDPKPPKPVVLGQEIQRRAHVLICAPSNGALDEIVMRLIQSGIAGSHGSAYSPSIVRVGLNPHHSVESVYLDNLVQQRVMAARIDSTTPILTSEIERCDIFVLYLFKVVIQLQFKCKTLHRVRGVILDEAAIVCSTLSFSGSAVFARKTRIFDVVVVDEASQASSFICFKGIVQIKTHSDYKSITGERAVLVGASYAWLQTAVPCGGSESVARHRLVEDCGEIRIRELSLQKASRVSQQIRRKSTTQV